MREGGVGECVGIADQESRLAALDPTGSFIVQAPAGSGKTELLIQRFLTLLGRVGEPESIVAITFTRKAAGEMRHRVISALLEAAEAPPEEDYKIQSWDLAQAALARDKERGWRLTEFPGRLRIQTIDALSGSLVRRMPWISRMGAAPQPEEQIEHLYRQAARATLDLLEGEHAVASSLDRLLRHLDNDLRTVEKLLTDMLRRRDQWLRHVVPHSGNRALRGFLESGLRQIVTEELQGIRSLFPQEQSPTVLELARFASGEFPRMDIDGSSRDGLPEADPEHFERWFEIADLLLTKKGQPRKGLNGSPGSADTAERRAAKARLSELELEELFRAKLHGVRSLPPSSFGEAQWEVLDALMQLLPLTVAQLKLVFQREGRVDFTEVAHAARIAMGTSETPTDLAFALDCRIQHLLVDEFQDTSQTQYELLHALTAGWQPGDGRTMFLVGDPMQSIYGFREAEVGLFLRARSNGIGHVRLAPLTLSVNFRSDGGIVRWVNDTMPPAFAEEEDLLTGAVTYSRSEPFHRERESPAVVTHAFFENDSEAEAERVLDIIQSTQEQDPDGTIAVLVRSRGHLASIVSALRRARKQFQALEIDPLVTRACVRDLLALTQGLLQPADRPAWLAMLRAPWCGLTLADLHALAGGDFSSSIWDLLQNDARLAAVSPDGRTRLDRFVRVIRGSIAMRGRSSFRRRVERTWISLGGPATLPDPTSLEDAASYLDLLDELSEGGELEDPEEFRLAVQSLFGRPDATADGRLQLLTIHKAKGLEFDTVILPGLGRTIRATERELVLWQEYVDAEGEARLLLAPIHEVGADKDPIHEYIRSIRARKEEHESVRLLYVAATRARRQLHLLGHTRRQADGEARPPAPRSLLAKIWYSVGPLFEEASRSGTTPEGFDVLDRKAADWRGVALQRLVLDWEPPQPAPDLDWRPPLAGDVLDEQAQPDGGVKFDWATELQRRVGIVAHAILGEVHGERPEVWKSMRIRTALRAEGLCGKPLEEAIIRVRAALAGTLEDPRGRWILSCHEDDAREYPLSGLIGGRVRRCILDRTFVADGVRWIIDYKTGTHQGSGLEAFLDAEQERYRAQLEDYGRIMRALDSRPIRLGLYFPMLQGWREWEFEDSDPPFD